MMGLDMMLKAMGLDAEQIKKSVEGFGEMILDIKTQLNRIETQQREILSHLQTEEHGKVIENGTDA